MEDQENFAHNVRMAGRGIETAEYELAVADAEEKKIIARVFSFGPQMKTRRSLR